MTNEEISADIVQYVKYALSLHIDRDAVAVLIAKRILFLLDSPKFESRTCCTCGYTVPETQFNPRGSCPTCVELGIA
jgi:hypothetical protein